MEHDSREGWYRLRIPKGDLTRYAAVLRELCRQAYVQSSKGGE